MKQILGLAVAVVLVITGCSTERHLLAPDPTARHLISPEAHPSCVGSFQQGYWHSCHRGVDSRSDCRACNPLFEVDPDQVTAH